MIRQCVGALLGCVVAASEPAAPPVRLDVIATTTTGAPIVDLRHADFELRENGIVRPIARVELRRPPAGGSNLKPIASVEDARRAAREAGSRVFAFVLDEFHVTPGPSSARVRESLLRFLDTGMEPGDLAVAIKPLDPVSDLLFTRDREALRAAIASFDGRKGDYAPHSAFEQQYIGHAPAAVETARTQIVSAALRDVALRLGELEADRGVIVLVSEGFARRPAGGQVRVPDLHGLVRAASRFHLAVYTFNPAGPDPDEAEPAPAQGTLEWLARETGGRAVDDGSAFESGLRMMAGDLRTYYALTYQPAQSDGRFHTLELVARRKNVQIRARPGYWASLGSEIRALLDGPGGTPTTPRRALRRSTAVNIWTGVTVTAAGATRLTLTWEPRGNQRAHSVIVKAATVGGHVLFEGTLAPVGADGGTAPKLATFDAPAGRVELDTTVLSLSGGTIDTDTRDIDVPDLAGRGKGPVILTPEIIRGRTAPEFRVLSADPLAGPTPSRAFMRGDRLLVSVPAWSPGGGGVRVTATVTNAIGGPMRVLDESGREDTRARFELPLAWLAPGDYQILFIAKSSAGEACESLRFSVK